MPVEDREWLTFAEAAEFLEASKESVAQWRRLGLMPNTQAVSQTQMLYLRADLQRIKSAPRRDGRGLDRRRLLEQIQAAAV